jgi:hypothetical protein
MADAFNTIGREAVAGDYSRSGVQRSFDFE